MHKKVYITYFVLPFFVGSTFAAGQAPQISCSYSGKFDQCYQANQGGSAREIKDFVCLDRAGDWQEVLTQIILDEKFQEIDEEIEDYISKLEESKCEYFGPEASDNFLRAVDDIEKNFPKYGYYRNKYEEICKTGVLKDLGECTDGVVNPEAGAYLGGTEKTSCLTLVEVKLYQARQVGYDLLKINKSQCRQDEHKKYVQKERTKYNSLLDLMRDIIGYLERLVNGWVTKTKDPK